MKFYISVLFTLFLLNRGVAQDSLATKVFPFVDSRIVYTNILEIDSATKPFLIARIKDWAVSSYGSQKSALQAEDADAGYVAYKGYLSVTQVDGGGLRKGDEYTLMLWHTIKFFVKDAKVKVQIEDLSTQSPLMIAITGDAPKERLEDWGKQLSKRSKKKQEKLSANVEENARLIDKQITELIQSVGSSLKKGKADFDF